MYDSAHIQEYIVQKCVDKEHRLLTGDMDPDLKAWQIKILGEGLLNAFGLEFFERYETTTNKARVGSTVRIARSMEA